MTLPQAADLALAQQVRLLSGGDFWHTSSLPEADVPATMLTDGPHGIRRQRGSSDHLGLASSIPATCFPPAVTLASSWDEALLEEVGRAVGAEARVLGVGVVLGPGLNLKRHPLGGRNFEYFSEDPLLTGRLAAAMVRGIQAEGVGACPKHFAVNNQEGHRFVVDAVVDERTLRELYLSGFEQVVTQARPWTIMAAYNSVNGTSATENHRLLTEILRDEWGWDGVVMSDWGATGDRVRALAAGLDLTMPGNHGIDDAGVIAAVQTGALPASTVAASAQRILDLVERAGSVDGPDPELPPAVVAAHDDLARRAAAAGTVLLANDGLLPLDHRVSVALIGPFADTPRYQGAGSSLINPTRVTSARAAFAEAGIRHTWDDGSDPARAAEVAAGADVAVLMVGLPKEEESEGFDRERFGLPDAHVELVERVCRAQPRTVVVLSNGGPVALPWREQPSAILESYLGGQASGGALTDVLFGVREPGGRLAESFPEQVSDLAADRWFPGLPRQVEYREGLFVGYRQLVSDGVAPAFPFGHGLGYTTFAWSDAATSVAELTAGEGLRVSVTVTNTGSRRGSEVVQVYRRDLTDIVLRPVRELVGFAKVELGPGESSWIDVEVPGRAFAFWDVSSAAWQVPEGKFALEVGRSSTEILAELEVVVRGGVTSSAEPPDTPAVAVTEEALAARLGHPVPRPASALPFTRDSTIEEISANRLGGILKKVLLRANPEFAKASQDPQIRLMIERAIDELPLRAAAQFSGGRLTWSRLDGVVRLLNLWPRRR